MMCINIQHIDYYCKKGYNAALLIFIYFVLGLLICKWAPLTRSQCIVPIAMVNASYPLVISSERYMC